MKKKIICGLLIIELINIFFYNNNLFSIEPALYMVPLGKFSQKVFMEKISKYRIILKDSGFDFPETVNQKILNKEKKGNDYILSLQAFSNNIAPGNIGSLKIYLEDTMLLDLPNPGIQKIKRKFKMSEHITGDVEDFVYDYISNKSLSVPMLPVTEILKNRTGDCVQHTVLAVSILRSLGIPSRALAGMLLSEEFEGSKNVFVYHMWAEAFVNDKWVLVDAANPGVKHPNRYIAFAYHHLRTEMPLSYLKAVSAMKNFSVEYADN